MIKINFLPSSSSPSPYPSSSNKMVQMIKIQQRSTPTTWKNERGVDFILDKRQPLGGLLGNTGSALSSAANSIFTGMSGGGNSGNQSGGSSSSGNNNNSGGSSGSSNNNNNNSGGGSSSNNNNNNNSGSSSNNNNNNSGGSSSSNNNNSGGSNSSSGNSSKSGGSGTSSSNNNNNSGESNSSNNSNSNSNSGSSSNNNSNGNSGSSSSNNNSNNNSGQSNGNSDGSASIAPVTLSNGAVVTPIAVVNQGTSSGSSGTTNLADLASQSIVVVLTNSNGQSVTSTVAYTSSISSSFSTGTNLNPINIPTSNAQELNGSSHGKKMNIGVIVGPIVAILLIVIAGLLFLIRRRKQNRIKNESGLIRSGYTETVYPSSNENKFLGKIKSIFSSSPSFGPIKLPSFPSFTLHSRSNSDSDRLTQSQQPREMRQAFTTVITNVHGSNFEIVPDSNSEKGQNLFGRLKRYDSKKVNKKQQSITSTYHPYTFNEEQQNVDDGGLQLIGFGSGPGSARRSINSSTSPSTVYFSPQTQHPRLHSVVDALNSGELSYDDDQSSLGHGQQQEEQEQQENYQSPGYTGSESAQGRKSYNTILQYSRAIGQSSSHNALSSMINMDNNQQQQQHNENSGQLLQNPFASPALSNGSEFSSPETNYQNIFPHKGTGEEDSIRSRDTFGISADIIGIPSSPMSEISDSTYGFSNPAVTSKNLLSPLMAAATASNNKQNQYQQRNQRLPSSFTSIEEEIIDDEPRNHQFLGIPDQIKNDIEPKRRGSFLPRRS